MSIAIALVPSLLFGALSLLLGAFPTDIRRQNTAVMVGAGAVSLGCAAMLGSSWSLSATAWGVACGLMWTGGHDLRPGHHRWPAILGGGAHRPGTRGCGRRRRDRRIS